jgi:uncharacterized membrane-anchored protein
MRYPTLAFQMQISCRLLAALLALAAPLSSFAQENPNASRAQQEKLVSELKYRKGEINLVNGLAKLSVPEEFRYLDSKDTETLLVKLWGNPPFGGNPPLGLLVPAGFNPIGGESWAVVIDYEEDGYVKDDEAGTIDYDKLLKQMQEGTREANKQRVKEGYAPVELVGWAAKPRYDRQTHKLYWAKEIKFGDSPEHTLNYNIRILGRRGMLVLNAVASMPQLAAIEAATPQILSMVDFSDGHRYANFDSKTDKVATYGIAALVAGGIAAKLGLLKWLWVVILAAKKFIIIGIVALVASLKKVFGKAKPPREAPYSPPSEDAS